MPTKFECTSPCGNCPFRKDAPLQHWDKSEFDRLRERENSEHGALFNCHKNNGSLCVGWLMDQRDHHYPSIRLRVALIEHGISYEHLEALSCPSERFTSVEEMCEANFPSEDELAGASPLLRSILRGYAADEQEHARREQHERIKNRIEEVQALFKK